MAQSAGSPGGCDAVVEIAALPGQLMLYVVAAIRAYGGAVLDEATNPPAEATAARGRRLLQRIFGTHKTGEPLPGPLADAMANLQDEDAVAALRLAIRKALTADPRLRIEVTSMVAEDGTTIDQREAGTATDQSSAPLGELSKSLIGQAAVGVTLAAAFIYAGGVLTLIFKLYYLNVIWTPVLGQLPHDFIITTAFGQVILPTVVMAALFTAFFVWYLNWYSKRRYKRAQKHANTGSEAAVANRGSWQEQSAASASAGCLGTFIILVLFNAAVLGLMYFILRVSELSGARYPSWVSDRSYVVGEYSVLFALLLFIFIYKVIYPSKIDNTAKHGLSLAIFLIALLPTMAAVSATTLLPVATLCGPSFHTQVAGKDKNWVNGYLIGSNSESIFITQPIVHNLTNKNIIVIPRSMVKAEIIGPASGSRFRSGINCDNVTESRPTPSPSKSRTR